jgi:hypothetical protein
MATTLQILEQFVQFSQPERVQLADMYRMARQTAISVALKHHEIVSASRFSRTVWVKLSLFTAKFATIFYVTSDW